MHLQAVGEDKFQEVKEILSKISAVYGRRKEFEVFADELLPSNPSWPLEDMKAKIEMYAKRPWPNCSVELQGSAARRVHNKHFSDVDFAISKTRHIEDNEFRDSCKCLSHDREIKFLRDSVESGKAIKLNMWGVAVDVACMDLYGTASLHSRDEIDSLESFYNKYPGAVRAVRVAKYMFRPLKGLDVEFIAHFVATDSRSLWKNRADDSEGWVLFRAILAAVVQYNPENRCPSCSYSFINSLMKNARSQYGSVAQEYVEAAMRQSRCLVECINFLQDKKFPARGTGEDVFLTHLLAEYENSGLKARQQGKLEERAGKELMSEFETKMEQEEPPTTGPTSATGSRYAKEAQGHKRVMEIVDNVIYCIERYGVQGLTDGEKIVLKGWCETADAALSMATEMPKSQRWKRRAMPSGFGDVHAQMLALGIDSADAMERALGSVPEQAKFKPLLVSSALFFRTVVEGQFI